MATVYNAQDIHTTGFKGNGVVNPNTATYTTLYYQFRVGTTQSAIDNDTDGTAGAGAGWTAFTYEGTNVDVNTVITGLTANTTYYQRLWLRILNGSTNTYVGSTSDAETTASSTTIAFSSMSDSASQSDAFDFDYDIDTNGNHCKVEIVYGLSEGNYTTVGHTSYNVKSTAPATRTGTLSGLTPNTLYYWIVRATVNATSTVTNTGFNTRTTLAAAPTFTAHSETNVGASNATLNATISHINCGNLGYVFHWGTSLSFGSSTTLATISNANTGSTNITTNLTGLTGDTTYYWKVVLTNTNEASPHTGPTQGFVTTVHRYAMMNPPIHKVGFRFSGDIDATRRYRNRNKPEFIPMFKTAVMANRTAYLGNVKYTELDGSVHRYGDRILKSKPAKPDLFTKSGYLDVVVEDGDEIVKLEEYGDRLLQFKKNILYVINLNSGAGEALQSVHPLMGIRNQAASIRTERGVIFVNKHGCHLFDGTKIRNLLISRKNESYKIDLDVWSSFITDYSQVGYVSDKSFVVVMDSAQAATSSGNMYIFDMNTESWVYAYQKMNDEDKTNFLIDNNGRLLFAGDGTYGQFYCIDGATGVTANPDIITREIDFEDPTAFKKVYKAYVTYKGTITNGFPQLQYDVDGSGSWSSAQAGKFYNVGLDKWARGIFTLKTDPIKCQSIKLRIYNSGSQGIDMAVNDIALEYRMLKGRVSDTGSSLDETPASP